GGGGGGVAAPVAAADRAVADADRHNDAGPVAGADDDVLRLRRAVHEVPRPQRPLLALHDQERLAGEHEEVLLVGLPVVHRHRLARPEDGDVDPELRELGVAREVQSAVRPSEWYQRASFALRTNQPAPFGTRP